MNFLKERMKPLTSCFSKPRGTSLTREAISHRSGETGGGGEAPVAEDTTPSVETVIADAAGDGETKSKERPPATTSFCEGERNSELMEKPPTDDVCPICFGDFDVPCRAPCGHWYCGSCILQYWNFSDALLPCKCPMCSQLITKLTPEASFYYRNEGEISKILRSVADYKRLFLGGIYGFMLKILSTPLYIKRIFHAMLNADRPGVHLREMRMVAVLLGLLYSMIPYDFLRMVVGTS
ncbi:hypothetical protein CASFOL_018052 [Castilleja foliolosa]|uniref:RING-type domain-containing protein n=1 Tax=Castilleja foliolosa TaxID=1961234 RepID=A0ABD3D912_9LAMI